MFDSQHCLAGIHGIAQSRIEAADETIQRLAETEIPKYLDHLLPMISEDARTVLETVLGDGKLDALRYRDAIAERHRIATAWRRLMKRYPLVLGPVSTMEAFPVGFYASARDAMRRLIRSFRLTELCNRLGLPSVAVPVHVAAGLRSSAEASTRTAASTRRN